MMRGPGTIRVRCLLALTVTGIALMTTIAPPAEPASPPPSTTPPPGCIPAGVPIPPLLPGTPPIPRCPKKTTHLKPKPTQPKPKPATGPTQPQQSSCAHASAPLKVELGTLAPDGFAEVSGGLPGGKICQPASFALSHNASYDPSDVLLGAGAVKASPGRFRAWLALPDSVPPGSYRLLDCAAAKPTKAECAPVGAVKVGAAPTIPAATPTLDDTHAVTKVFDLHGGSLSVQGPDGSTFVLTIPEHAALYLPITMTPVTALTPASAAGNLVTGVLIEPVGENVAGATLAIKRASWPKGAHAVAFGGVDPSGGAFPLPALVANGATRIPLTTLGGYGIATSGSGSSGGSFSLDRRSLGASRPVPCSLPLALPTSALGRDDGGARPVESCIAIAEKYRFLQAAAQQAVGYALQGNASGSTVAAILGPLLESAANVVGDEIDAIVNQPPTESGAIELQVIVPWSAGVDRQAELLGIGGNASFGKLLGRLAKASQYQRKLIRSVCLGAQKQPSGIYIDYATQLLGNERQLELLGYESGLSDALSLIKACMERVRFELKGEDDATVEIGDHWSTHVVVTADATIKGKAQDVTAVLDPGTPAPSLGFTTATATAVGVLAQCCIVTLQSKGGTFRPAEIFGWVTKRVRCDASRKFVIDRKVFMSFNVDDLWNDNEQLQLNKGGATYGPNPAAAAAQSWDETYPPSAGRTANRIAMQLDGPPLKKQGSGTCSETECKSYSYEVSLEAMQLDN